jgi:hypothetical protein
MDQREGSEYRRLVGIDELLRRVLRTSARNHFRFGGGFRERSKGDERGEGGGFIGVARRRSMQEMKGI